jgi:CheY-like chemotaxis protein
VLENIEERVLFGELNTKVSYSSMLIHSLSHELFTPINHLVGSAEKLELLCSRLDVENVKKSEVEALSEEAKLLFQTAQCLTIFVQNILDFGKFMNRSLQVECQTIYLRAEIADLLGLFSVKLKRKRLKLELNCEEFIIESDKDKIRGLLFIFVENSIKYTNKGIITVNIKKGRSYKFIRFEIIDTGIGIDDDDMDKITMILKNPFEDIKTTGAAGIGIGLRIAQILLIHLSRGDLEIDIKSTKGEGTVVCFEILRKSRPQDALETPFNITHLITKQFKGDSATNFNITSDAMIDEGIPLVAEKIEEQKESEVPISASYVDESEMTLEKASLQDSEENPQIPRESDGIMCHMPLVNLPRLMGRVGRDRDRNNTFHSSCILLRSIGPMRMNSLSVGLDNLSPNGRTRKSSFFQTSSVKSPSSNITKDIHNDKRIAVVVDDEILNADLLESWLELLGFKVYVAYNGELAISLFSKLLTYNLVVSVVFMDYSMPTMNGDECVRKLKTPFFDRVLSKAVIIGLTAHRDPSIKKACLNSGMNIVEYKPFSFALTKQLLENLDLCASANGINPITN